MQSKATTVDQYLAELPADRRAAIAAVRKVLKANLDKRVEEGMQYGMIGYYIPHKVFPAGYHCDPKQPLPFACLASQKNHMSVYLMSVYGGGVEENWFRERWAKTGKKLDMGKCCIRFKKLEDLALDVVGESVSRVSVDHYLAHYISATGHGAECGAFGSATLASTQPAKSPGVPKRKAPVKQQAPAKKAAPKKKTAKRPAKRPAKRVAR